MPRRQLATPIAHLVDAPLDRDEFLRRIRAPLRPDEITHAAELARWFTRRYPTAGERLAYVRRAYARWNRILPPVKR